MIALGLGLNRIKVSSGGGDVDAPTVLSATVADGDKDALVVVFNEAVNVTNVTGLSFTGAYWTGVGFSSIQSGNGTDTVTFDLDTDIGYGETGSFAYSGSNTIEDLSGNGLAASSTAVTNNVAAATLPNSADSGEKIIDGASAFPPNEDSGVTTWYSGYDPTGATVTAIANSDNGYGDYVHRIVATDAATAQARHHWEDGTLTTVYRWYLLYRMIQGTNGRIRLNLGWVGSNGVSGLSATDWTLITGTVECDGTAIQIDVLAANNGAIDDEIQYKLSLKPVP